MRILLAVIDDLFSFARTALFGVFFIKPHEKEYVLASFLETAPQLQLPTMGVQSLRQHVRIFETSESNFIHGEQYFIGERGTYLYVDPVVSFDTASLKLACGELVHVLKLGGRWAHVSVGHVEGWVFKDTLREQAKDVFPVFAEGIVYDSQNEETKKLRSCIEDMFGGDAASLVLTDAEYVTYKLQQKGRSITWPTERPRTAGTWQKILRGQPSIHMSITPKTESVIEYSIDDVGHLCFIEAVFPDESIKISSISMYQEGMYADAMLLKDAWKELRPVFIEIT